MIDQIKQAASGRWLTILALPLQRIDHNGQRCPKCTDGGTDRFHLDREFATNGKVYCRHCLPKGSGDGVGTYAWFHGIENSEAIKRLGSELGINPCDAPKRSLIEHICSEKRMPIDAFMQFEPTLAKRGKLEVVRVPVWNSKGEKHSYFDLWPGDKGKFARGAGMAGMFFPGRLPKPGETWLVVEGVKDSAALLGLGYLACGMPTCKLSPIYAELFRDVHITFVPDLDLPGQSGAQSSGGVLHGIAASVRIARLPGEIKQSQGEDVRDVLRK